MILEHPIKGGIVEAKPLTRTHYKKFKPVLCLTDSYGQRFYLSWENLTKLLNNTTFDVDQKRIRKHLIPTEK